MPIDPKTEVKNEFSKDLEQLGEDIINETNTHPSNPEGEKENLDLIKHLLKRIALHQLVTDKQNRKTNIILIILSIIMAIGSLFTVMSFFKQ